MGARSHTYARGMLNQTNQVRDYHALKAYPRAGRSFDLQALGNLPVSRAPRPVGYSGWSLALSTKPAQTLEDHCRGSSSVGTYWCVRYRGET
jgi:hypothetical protein